MIRVLSLGVLLWLAAGASLAKTVLVAGHGTDSGICGTSAAPCRSISQAIANAVDGDTISVGPGYYGDLDRDGVWGEPGEELGLDNATCSCVVELSKRVTLISKDGAASTVIDADGDDLDVIAVLASGAGSKIGKAGHGFTLRNSGEFGFSAQLVPHLDVEGNVAEHNAADGFNVRSDGMISRQNRAIENGDDGFTFVGAGGTSTGDVAIGNFDRGFVVEGSDNHLTGAVSIANRQGFIVSLTSGPTRIDKSAALGNQNEGVVISDGVNLTLTSMSIVGNDAVSGNNCGVTNNSALTIHATKSWWGAATGPGALPANLACNPVPGSVTDTSGFLKKELHVLAKPLR
ncbi:MAG TPA: hypothetical protein VMR86_09155 [Myxococcota bacterium]|nr:hypothetical protein [Myxococcota bacterium]